MILHIGCWLLLLTALPVSAQSIRVASFHISDLSTASNLERVADLIQQYDLVAIQDVSDLAAADQLLAILFRRGDFFKILPSQPSGDDPIRYAFAWRDRSVQILAPGSFIDIDAARRPVFAAFRAGDLDFVAVNYQTTAPAQQASEELDRAYRHMRKHRPDEGDVLIFASLAQPTQPAPPLLPALPLDSPVPLDGSQGSANIYLSMEQTREFTGAHGVDRFDQGADESDSPDLSAVSQRRPVWIELATGKGDDDGPGIEPPSAVVPQSWGRTKAPLSTPSSSAWLRSR